MGASTSKFSDKDIQALKNAVDSLKREVTNLKETTSDVGKNLSQNIDYTALAQKINNDTLSESLVTTNQGALGTAVSSKLTAEQMKTMGMSLSTDQKFAQALADVLVDESSKYAAALRGSKGAQGDISSSKDRVKENLYDKGYTLWCADGNYCELPVGKKGLKIGKWIFQQHDNGNLHIHEGNVNEWSAAVTPGQLHASGGLNVHSGNLNVNNGSVNIPNGQVLFPGGWAAGGDNTDHLRFFKGGDLKAAIHENGGYWGRTYGSRYVHDWARDEFSRKGHQHWNHAPNWESKETWGSIRDPGA